MDPAVNDIDFVMQRVYLIYDTTKTALLNKLYYGRRLEQYRRYNFWMEIIIAVGATGSGVAGLALWKTEYGQLVWGALSAFSIILATLKPSLKLTEKVEAYAKLYGEYTGAFTKMSVHLEDIQLERRVSDERLKAFGDLRVQAAELETLGDPVQDEALVRALEGVVNKKIPIDRLWVPQKVEINQNAQEAEPAEQREAEPAKPGSE
jgi:hypothetical protein